MLRNRFTASALLLLLIAVIGSFSWRADQVAETAAAATPDAASAIPLPGINLQPVPDLLDNLYKYNVNSVSDLVTYVNAAGALKQAFLYWASDRRLHITERDFPYGRFGGPVDVHDAIGGEMLEFDSHNASALGVAADGTMFITGNQHADQLNMARSARPYDIGSFRYLPPAAMVAASEVDRITYPSFFRHRQYLYFSYREQEVGRGAPRYRWMLTRYDPSAGTWASAMQFNTGIALRLYVSNIAVSADGESMHLVATWRDDLAGGGTANQHNYFHLYSTNGSTWRILGSDTRITAGNPLWYDNGNTVLPGYTGTELTAAEMIWKTPPDPVPEGAGAVTTDAAGRPHALVSDVRGTLYHHLWNGKAWEQRTLDGWSANSHDIITCDTRVGALLSEKDRIYYRSLDRSDKSYRSPVLLAKGYTTSHYSLSVDQEAIRRGYVSLLLTANSHHRPGSITGANPQPAWIATVPCAELETVVALTLAETH